jgi:solute carrier family 36 (proton-coupled amino acid transporter)
MTSPSQPLSINLSSTRDPNDLENQPVSYTPSVGTPDLRAIRAQFAGLPPNIPPRGSLTTRGGPSDLESQPASYTRAQFGGLPSNIPPRGSVTPSLRPTSSNVSLQALPDRSALHPTPQLISGLSATRQAVETSSATPPPITDLDDLPAEEKARILGRHLVPKEQRMKATPEGKSLEDLDGVSGSGSSPFTLSRRSSNGISHRQQEDLEPFPIPYDAPGADVT